MRVNRVCANTSCKGLFTAREADVKRGWAKYCSKSCKAVVQEKRTGQYRELLAERDGQPHTFANAHLYDNTGYDK